MKPIDRTLRTIHMKTMKYAKSVAKHVGISCKKKKTLFPALIKQEIDLKRTNKERNKRVAGESGSIPEVCGSLESEEESGNALAWPEIKARRSDPRSKILRRRDSLALSILRSPFSGPLPSP